MSIKSFLALLILSCLITVLIPLIGFATGYHLNGGFPLQIFTFSFLGGSTNYANLFIDIAIWFALIFIIWKLVLKRLK